MNRPLKDYAVYKGDGFLFIATKKECAERMGVSENTISFYASETYKRRLAKRDSQNAIVVVTLGFQEVTPC